MDREGYGYGEHQSLIDRLLSDLRTLGPSGIERIADSYQQLEQVGHRDRFHQREREALHAIEASRGEDWDNLRAQVHHLTDGGGSLQSWKAEHGEIGHRAEAAVLAGALGLLALPALSREHYQELVAPLASALPWVGGISSDGSVKEAPAPE